MTPASPALLIIRRILEVVILTLLKSPKVYRQSYFKHLQEATRHPDRDLVQGEAFSRHRKLDLFHTTLFISSLENNSIGQQTRTFLKTHHIDVSASAFCQARSKFNHKIIKDAALSFTKEIAEDFPLYKGKYRLIGVDGSNFPLLPNPDEPQNLVPGNGEPHYGLHFNAAYDLINKFYTDYEIQSASDKNENQAGLDFVQRYDYSGIPVWIFDRLYFSYELATQIQESAHKYLMRMKERDFNSLLEDDHNLGEVLDYEGSRMLVNTQKADIKAMSDLYKYVPKGKVSLITENEPELFFSYRLICVEIESQNETTGEKITEMEYLITNLDPEEFDAKAIKELYHLRWNIETSFRHLKYVLKAKQVHSRKQNLIEQEIDAAVMVFNLISAISKCALPKQKGSRYEYQVNLKFLSWTVRQFLDGKATQKEVIWAIENKTEPIRKNRHFKRVTSSSVVTSHWN